MLMTPDVIVKACKDNGGYRQPHLNDQLFLQCRGFGSIENLEPYVNLKVLWLEQNALQHIENIGHLTKLCSLFLQNNTIRDIGTGLHGLSNLRVLNLSHNYLTKIPSAVISCCPLLETLQLSHNRVECLTDIEGVWSLPSLGCLDISYNKIDERRPENMTDTDFVDFFARIPELSVLYVHGQALPRSIKNYRKTMVYGLKKLTYLDERPIFPQERRTVEAWGAGGVEAERDEMEKIKQEKYDDLTSCLRFQKELVERNKETKAQREKEYAERLQREEARRAALAVEYARMKTELDHEEYEARRTEVEVVEETEWEQLVARATDEHRAAMARKNERETQERERMLQAEREAAAAAEIELRQRQIEEEYKRATAARQASIDEMNFWIQKMAEDDAAVENGMQQELHALLQQLQPASAGPRLLPVEDASERTRPDTVSSDVCRSDTLLHGTDGESSSHISRKSHSKRSKVLSRWASSAARFEHYYAMENTKLRR